MSLFREIPPTAGWPVYGKDLLACLQGRCPGTLENDFRNYLKAEEAKVVNSGTAAFYIILETLKGLSGKRTVVIPSYICSLVPLAIKRAGLNVEVCDITGRNFNYNIAELEKLCVPDHDILAIVTAHIGGLPADFDAVNAIAQKHGIPVIEDCAQSLGAVYKKRPVGTLGDFSFFSLCRGKGLTIYEGGVVVTARKKYAQPLRAKTEQLARQNPLGECVKLIEFLGYWIFYRPALFWPVFKLPQRFWLVMGNAAKAFEDYYEIDFPVHGVSPLRQSLAHASFYRLEAEVEKQRAKAAYCIRELEAVPGLTVIQEGPGARATFPFVTLIFDDIEKRKEAFRSLNHAGLGVSQIYTAAVTDFEFLRGIVPPRDMPGANYLASRAITLSTSVFLSDRDLAFTVQKIKELVFS